jgi:hypothetical protein
MIALSVMMVLPLLGSNKHEYQTGKLLDVTTDERLVEGTTVRHAIFTVQIGELVYTTRGGHISHHAGDYAQGLIVGDAVQVSIDGEHMLLLKPDGKELKTKIIKRARTQQ